MKQLEDLLISTPEISMKHYSAKTMTPRAVEQNNLASKEASYVQAVGYAPSSSISSQEWENQLVRNEISKSRGGMYVQKADPVRNSNSF